MHGWLVDNVDDDTFLAKLFGLLIFPFNLFPLYGVTGEVHILAITCYNSLGVCFARSHTKNKPPWGIS